MGPNGYYCSGLSKFKWIMDDKSMIMVSHSLFSSASYCPRIWMQWGWSLWTTTSQFVSPTVWHRTWATSEILRLLEVVYTTIQDRCEINHDLGKKTLHPKLVPESSWNHAAFWYSIFISHVIHVSWGSNEPRRTGFASCSFLDAIEKPTCEGWNRLEPVGTRLGGFREAIAQKMKALCWVKVSVHWGRGRGGRGGRGSRNWLFFEVEHDAPLDLGVHVSFQTNPHVEMVRTLKLLKSSNLLGDDPPPSLAGGLAIETSINSFSEHGAVCSNMFQHWGMLLRLVSPLFWNNSFWWILRVQTFWVQP